MQDENESRMEKKIDKECFDALDFVMLLVTFVLVVAVISYSIPHVEKTTTAVSSYTKEEPHILEWQKGSPPNGSPPEDKEVGFAPSSEVCFTPSLEEDAAFSMEQFPLTILSEEMLTHFELSDRMYDVLYYFVDHYGWEKGYEFCEIIEVVESPDETGAYGVSVGMVFENERYVCVWLRDGSWDALVLYDTPLTDRLVEMWEYI